METVAPFKEVIEEIKEAGGEAFRLCFQCGLCDTVCPWNRVRQFSIRKIIRQATFGLTEIDGEDISRAQGFGASPVSLARRQARSLHVALNVSGHEARVDAITGLGSRPNSLQIVAHNRIMYLDRGINLFTHLIII